jgi:outer membrane biosynthesis protein TonB
MAIEAVRSWRFMPGLGGRPATGTVTIELDFTRVARPR